MVFVLGVQLPDKKLARVCNTIISTLIGANTRTQVALQAFYGVGESTAARLCARLQIHNTQRVRNLTPQQITSLASFLSSPHTAPALPRLPLATPDYVPPPLTTPTPVLNAVGLRVHKKDPLLKLKVEAELRREMRENIAHQRMIGSYVGRRHAMSLPVRGQNTQTNAKTAKKLNRVERYN